jgi:hypothetical protein
MDSMPKSILVKDLDDDSAAYLKGTAGLERLRMGDLVRELLTASRCPWPGCTHDHGWHAAKRAAAQKGKPKR